MPDLRVSGIVEESVVDGPGVRFVVFTQGCEHHCPGCHNSHTHALDGGTMMPTDAILARFDEDPLLSGITFSGGEPFLQPEALADLAEAVHARGKDVMVYSGFTFEQLLEQEGQDPAVCRLLEQADILVDGPYVESRRNLELEFRGSDNQRLLNREAMRRLREARKAAPVAKADAGV
ncbi:anaerobic ribonucleoside-triphosphate reductase activating protein [uncultured Desulfovibrio sp.]|uniref:anaerobic ribonucleoside-triphosphate reductase activating protein n=1 Tax=uncultured Desulfovibrio sp. TaxID=167968 RepID=UPI0026037018|nr:anaerobic ribonucleoside-triphosphate reductase activating protein [uncultured Desulfovibrio sp.]